MIFSNISSRKSHGTSHRIFNPRRVRRPKYRTRRMIIIGIMLITLLFIGKIILSFFNFEHVSFALFGNIHYTEGQIYNVLGENLDNIFTDSESKTAKYIRDNLSYIKDVHVTRNLAKRLLTIEVTERKVFALLKLYLVDDPKTEFVPKLIMKDKNNQNSFLIDQEGYVLESIQSKRNRQLIEIIDEGEHIPEIGKQIKSITTQFGIQVLKHVRSRKPDIAKDLKSIDARNQNHIVIQIESLPIPVWIAGDMVEIGFHNLRLFINQGALSILQNRRLFSVGKKNKQLDTGSGHRSSQLKYTYLDARYKDTIYLGGANK